MSGRVCVIRQSIYPYDSLVRREAETLLKAGYETHIICLDDPEGGSARKRGEIINGVVVHRLPLRRLKTGITRYVYDYLSFAFLAFLKLTALHARYRFKVIQVNTMPDFLVFSTIIPKLLGTKIVAMMYEPTPELWTSRYGKGAAGLLKVIEQLVLSYVDCSCTVTEQLREAYVARGAKASKIKVVLNVPEEAYLDVTRGCEEARMDAGRFVLVCHGAIEDRYGHDTLVEAVALARRDVPSLHVKILGKGSCVGQLLENIRRLGLEDCVECLGYLPLERMVAELRCADVGIVAQKASAYSNLVHTGKMYDYIALGKPVIASRLKSVEAYFGHDALRYFEPGNPVSLADAIVDLYRHPVKRDMLRRSAESLYREYRWEKQKETYLSIYRDVVQ